VSHEPDDTDDITDEERAQATAFARLVDASLEGEATPPASTPQERELIAAATALRAGLLGRDSLGDDRRRSLIEDVMTRAARRGEVIVLPPPPRDSETKRKVRLRDGLPWLLTAISVAVALLLFLRPPPRIPTPLHETSRPADVLVGPIDRKASGDASGRLDAIYADRLAGYRAVRLGGAR
jgi:hypothetical protein